MAHRRLTSLLLRHRSTISILHHQLHYRRRCSYIHFQPHTHPQFRPNILFSVRFLSTRSPGLSKSGRPDIGVRARQFQNRRLWTYALTLSCIAGFVVIVINQFQDQLVFYVTPSEALEKYTSNP